MLKLKECKGCKVTKPLAEFHKNKNLPDGHTQRCKDCACASSREYRQSNPDRLRSWFRQNPHKIREYNLKHKYGLTENDVLLMLEKQGSSCAICATPFEEGQRTYIDHDHESKVVRGILCNNCNTGLGKFKDSPDFLLRAWEYLRYDRA